MALPDTTGTNCWTKAEDLMADVLVACPAFLTWLGAANEAAARSGNMYIDSMGEEPEEFANSDWLSRFPSVIIGTPGDQDDSFLLEAVATGPAFNGRGFLELIFSQIADGDLSEAEQERNFKNHLGTIFEEMTDQPMCVQSISVQQYGRNPEEDHVRLGEIQFCRVTVPWGTITESDS
jgi:hypothetical protein